MAQHRKTQSVDRSHQFWDCDAQQTTLAGGRHRTRTRVSARRSSVAVSIAAAAGALITAGAQYASPAQAQAAPIHEATPAQDPVAAYLPQILAIPEVSNFNRAIEQLAKGQQLTDENATRDAAALRPLFVRPVAGTLTSDFGPRWGTTHPGLDIANSIGTPVYAAADGTVLDSGPADGFGLWVRLQHDDGSTTVYGHIDQTLVAEGQRVQAGEQIATVGNRGQSTGPHLHFEVADAAGVNVDPKAWLASRGVALSDAAVQS
ncbi:M23 family metallopeptidase [Rhodococcoides yunnanense]|uniref:M23 family metallopeptidase n=1 Tax=Rhodococcoides yunnanense TaxID=278209 RepID=A0ABU4BCM6_9NOCA|nr:M23 family metallopeptidase [Rhodococcus yunnanensis]MDV6261965.1 M23 family metallopeptidase [Rhodococcus yunnanensis]